MSEINKIFERSSKLAKFASENCTLRKMYVVKIIESYIPSNSKKSLQGDFGAVFLKKSPNCE
jgi:hypothetical protein